MSNGTSLNRSVSRLRPRLHLDAISPEQLARWAAPEFAADPVDEARLRNSPPWQAQAAMMERAWLVLCCLAVLALLFTLLYRLMQCRRRPECMGQTLHSFLHQTLSVDLRALALFRIYFSAVMLYEIAKQWWHLRILRTDQALFYGYYEPPDPVSGVCPHCLSPSFAWQAFMMVVTLAVFFGMMLGWRSTEVTFAACVLFRSMLLAIGDDWQQGCDSIANSYLFWATLLPWGSSYSLDAGSSSVSGSMLQVASQPILPGEHISRLQVFRRRLSYLYQASGLLDVSGKGCSSNPKSHSVVSGGTVGLLLSMFDLYWSCVANRTGQDWTQDYSAIWNLFHDPCQTKPFGHFLAQFPWLCRLLCFFAMKAEFWCPFLLLTGALWSGAARGAACIIMVGFHISLGLAIPLGWFQAVTLAPWIAFLPPMVCDALHTQLEWMWHFWGSRTGAGWLRGNAQAIWQQSADGNPGSKECGRTSEQRGSTAVEQLENGTSNRRRRPHITGTGITKSDATKDAASFASMMDPESLAYKAGGPVFIPLLGLRGIIALAMASAFLLARFDYSPELYEFFTGNWGLGHTMRWKLYQITQLVVAEKMTLVGKLANGAEVVLNHHGFEASRQDLLAYAREQKSTDDWFTFGDGIEGGVQMDTFVWPRQLRQALDLLSFSEPARLMMLNFWCYRWNHEDGGLSPSDPQRMLTIDWYKSTKMGMVDPTRGFMGVKNIRSQERPEFTCGYTWQDHMRGEGFTEEDMRHMKQPEPMDQEHMQQDLKKSSRNVIRELRFIEQIMRSHQLEGGKGEGRLRIDFGPGISPAP